MSLFRSQAKIFGQISRNDITVPRSASTQRTKYHIGQIPHSEENFRTRLTQSKAELKAFQHVEENPFAEEQRSQITNSKSLFHLFRKRDDNVGDAISQENKGESWFSKLFGKPPRTTTPQGRSMMETREIQIKQEVGFVKLPNPEFSIEANSNYTVVSNEIPPRSNINRITRPMSSPPSTRHEILQGKGLKHDRAKQLPSKEEDSHLHIPRFYSAHVRDKRNELVQKFEDEPEENTSDLHDKRKAASVQGHGKIDRKFPWYPSQSVEISGCALRTMQANKALMHTGRRTVQYFTRRSYLEPHKLGKIRGYSLQTQVTNRKFALAQNRNKGTPMITTRKAEINVKDTEPPCIGKDIKDLNISSDHFPAKFVSSFQNTPNEKSKTIPSVRLKPPFSDVSQSNYSIRSRIKRNTTKPVVMMEIPSTTMRNLRSKLRSEGINNTYTHSQKNTLYEKEKSYTPRTSHIQNNNTRKQVRTSGRNYLDISNTSNKNEIITFKEEKQNSQSKKKSSESMISIRMCQSHVERNLELRKWIKRAEEKERKLRNVLPKRTNILESEEQISPNSEDVELDKYDDLTEKQISSDAKQFHKHQMPSNKLNLRIPGNLKEMDSKFLLPATNNNPKTSITKHAIHLTSKIHPNQQAATKNPVQALTNQKYKNPETVEEGSQMIRQVINDKSHGKQHKWKNVLAYTESKMNKNNPRPNLTFNHDLNTSDSVLRNSLEVLQKLKPRVEVTRNSNVLSIHKSSIAPPIENLTNHSLIAGPQKQTRNNLSSIESHPGVYEHNININDRSKYKESIKRTGTENSESTETGFTSVERLKKLSTRKTQSNSDIERKEFSMHANNALPYKGNEFNEKQVKDKQMDQPINLPFNHKVLKSREINSPQKAKLSLSTEKQKTRESARIKKEDDLQELVKEQLLSNISLANVQKLISQWNQNEVDTKEEEEGAYKLDEEGDDDNEVTKEEDLHKVLNSLEVKGSKGDLQTITHKMQNSINEEEDDTPCLEKSLVPIETKTAIMNKNWTFGDIASYFYGAIFSKHDLLNMDLHKAIGKNDEEWQPVVVGKKPSLLNDDDTGISAGLSESKTFSKLKESLEESTIDDKQSIVKETSGNLSKQIDESTADINVPTMNFQSAQSTINEKKEESDDVEDDDPITSSVKPIIPNHSLPTVAHLSKRSYSNWNVQDPPQQPQSPLECKDKTDKCEKKKIDKCAKKPKPKRKKKEKCRKIVMPGCRPPISIECCDENVRALPCAKREPPSPSFSEHMKFPLMIPKKTECDCHEEHKLIKCPPRHQQARKVYDACLKKKPKKICIKPVKEEEICDDDEGKFPPCPPC